VKKLGRYVIVCQLTGDALASHKKLMNEVCRKFEVKRTNLSGHFTIKAPFEADERISEIDKLTQEFSKFYKAASVKLDGFGSFRTDVAFVNVILSPKALDTYKAYIALLKQIPWLKWKEHDGLGENFHATIASKLKPDKFAMVMDHLSSYDYNYDVYFDNISLYRWENTKWILYKEYPLIH
jgi:2'-5' RNA ligase